jgi:hypothetical protein
MSMAMKSLTKDTVTPRTGTFLHKTELDIDKVFQHVVGEHVMKAYTAVRGV